MSRSVLLLVGDYTEDYEAMVPFQALGMLGHDVDAVCPDRAAGETIATSVHTDEGEQTYAETRGHDFELTATFDDVDPTEYDALFLPGGRAPEYLRTYDAVIEATRHFFAADKPVAAVCHGQQILTAADVVDGYEMTATAPLRPDCEAVGATWADDVTRDRNLVTGRNWDDLGPVLEVFVGMLGDEVHHADGVATADD